MEATTKTAIATGSQIEDRNYRRTVLIISGDNATMEFNVRNGKRMKLAFNRKEDGTTIVSTIIGTAVYQTVYTNPAWKVQNLSNENVRRHVIESFLINQINYYGNSVRI